MQVANNIQTFILLSRSGNDTYTFAQPKLAVGIDAVTVVAVNMAVGNSEVATSAEVNSAAELQAAENRADLICSAETTPL